MKVTDIQRQKNNSQRVSIFIDDEYSFSLDEVDAVLMNIKIGRELTENDISGCIFKSQYAKAKDKALDILSRKSVSRKMLVNMLMEKKYDKEIADAVCDELESLGYIDDYAYAMMFLEYASEKLWGEKRIRYELSLKGIDKNIIEDAMESVSSITAEELSEHILSRYPQLDLKDIKSKQRVQRYFASRGFDFALINSAIRICIENAEE